MYYTAIHSNKIYKIEENQFNQNLMNSIGVDFKFKAITIDNKNIKLQIVRLT
jgi:hypothetical protein